MLPATLGLCLSLLAGNGAAVFVPGEFFTLAWTHSIERQRWEEDYRVQAEPAAVGGARLQAVQARIRGSGAGMEPPAGAVLHDGWYAYTPAEQQPAELLLSRSAVVPDSVPDYELCVDGAPCQPLAHWLASDGGATRVRACAGSGR